MSFGRRSRSWEALAHQLFDDEWRRIRKSWQCEGLTAAECESCPSNWLLPELIDLLEEAHERSVGELEPAVRELVAEQNFVEESGDPVIEGAHHQVTELYVTVSLRVLERVRQRAFDEGAWSNMPATPQMFG